MSMWVYHLKKMRKNWGSPCWLRSGRPKFKLPSKLRKIIKDTKRYGVKGILVFTITCTSKFERSTGSESERVDALGLRTVEVITCMITRDFSVISMTSQASLSLSTSHQKSLTHNIGSASALPIISWQKAKSTRNCGARLRLAPIYRSTVRLPV